MADALVSEASVARHEGSTPSLRTLEIFIAIFFFFSIIFLTPCPISHLPYRHLGIKVCQVRPSGGDWQVFTCMKEAEWKVNLKNVDTTPVSRLHLR